LRLIRLVTMADCADLELRPIAHEIVIVRVFSAFFGGFPPSPLGLLG
jgi:hypothetical protein